MSQKHVQHISHMYSIWEYRNLHPLDGNALVNTSGVALNEDVFLFSEI